MKISKLYSTNQPESFSQEDESMAAYARQGKKFTEIFDQLDQPTKEVATGKKPLNSATK